MKIGEVAQQAGVSASIIRYYEHKGLLPQAARDACGYRVYGDADLARVQFVTGARRLGFSFRDIREVLAVRDTEEAPGPRVLELISEKVAEAGQRISRLRTVRHELTDLQQLAHTAAGSRRYAPIEYEIAE